jgi:UDP-N-acetylglucosamine/UDP-N-acetylgalactosamine diphosphorylase
MAAASVPALPSLDAVASLPDAEIDALLSTLQGRFTAAGQGHVFAFVPSLSAEQRRALAAELVQLRVENIQRDWNVVQQQRHEADEAAAKSAAAAAANEPAAAATAAAADIAPFTQVTDLSTSDPETRRSWRSLGLDLLAKGKVAALLMAGGQGTRLGSSAPKGCFDIGLRSGSSLFQLQAERLQRLRCLAATHAGKKVDEVHIRWYIMTSLATHESTVLFFRTHGFFGLPEEDIFFFRQSELPALDDQGRILMERTDKVCLAPNGNGGIFEGLQRQGALDDMERSAAAATLPATFTRASE